MEQKKVQWRYKGEILFSFGADLAPTYPEKIYVWAHSGKGTIMRRFQKVFAVTAAVLMLQSSITGQARANIDTEVPIEIQIACNKYGAEYNIAPEILEAIIYTESRYIPTVSNSTCKGLMQINEPAHKQRMKDLEVKDIYDIDGNIHVGADYLGELFEQYEDIGIVLGLYHGEKNAVKNGRNGKLSSYTQAILKKAEELTAIHEGF